MGGNTPVTTDRANDFGWREQVAQADARARRKAEVAEAATLQFFRSPSKKAKAKDRVAASFAIIDEMATQFKIDLQAEARARTAQEVSRLRANMHAKKERARVNKIMLEAEAARMPLRLRKVQGSKTRKKSTGVEVKEGGVAPSTDDNIMDEEAGRKRLQLARESAERRQAEIERIKQANAELRRRLKHPKPKSLQNLDEFGEQVPSKSPKVTTMTAAALYRQWRPKTPEDNDEDARDGHITEYERKLAARGGDLSKFPNSTWTTPDWAGSKGGNRQPPVLGSPVDPSPNTHTQRFIGWYSAFAKPKPEQLAVRL